MKVILDLSEERQVIYYNLSQCSGEKMVYFRSTDIEQKNYHRLLWSIPDEWFYWLYKGKEIKVIDKSSNRKGKVERIFLPILCDVLNKIYFNDEPKNKSLINHYELAFNHIDLDTSLRTRVLFWKGKIQDRVSITGETIIVEKEPNPLSDTADKFNKLSQQREKGKE